MKAIPDDIKKYEVVDAKGAVLGRMGSLVAKHLLQGRYVAIVNAGSAIISGSRSSIKSKYMIRLNLQEKENPEHSPYWPRRSDMLVKRIIRGMLPYRSAHGKEAYERLRVYISMPDEFKDAKKLEIEKKDPSRMYSNYTTIAELSRLLGYEKKM